MTDPDPWEDAGWPGWRERSDPPRRRGVRWPWAILILAAVSMTLQFSQLIPESCESLARSQAAPTRYTASVVSVDCPAGRWKHPGFVSRGSAFRTGDERWLTASHVLDTSVRRDGYTRRWYLISRGDISKIPASRVHRNARYDVASFESSAPGRIMPLADDLPDPGESVTAWGQSDIHGGRYRLAFVGTALDDPGTVVTARGPVAHGYSGGPLVDQKGRTVGVIYAITDELTLATPTSIANAP
jgi:hypothetical protein